MRDWADCKSRKAEAAMRSRWASVVSRSIVIVPSRSAGAPLAPVIGSTELSISALMPAALAVGISFLRRPRISFWNVSRSMPAGSDAFVQP